MDAFAGILEDVRYAARGLRRSPGFTLTAIVMLAVAIGLNAAVFTVIDSMLFKGFPLVHRNDRLVYIRERESNGGMMFPYPDFADWREHSKTFKNMAALRGLYESLATEGHSPQNYLATTVSASLFGLLGVKPILGRDFRPDDERAGAPPVAILRYDLWEHRFGKDPGIIGRVVRLNGTPTTIIGVMPPGFSFPQNNPLWLPLKQTPKVLRRDNNYVWFVLGRLADGVTLGQARAEMHTLALRLAQAYPDTNQNVVPVLENFNQFFIGTKASLMYKALWGAVAFVLLMACANVANLLLGRAMDRSREISVRTALGAGRWRIVRQLLLESLLLSAGGGFLGWGIAKAGLHLYALGQGSNNWAVVVLGYPMDVRAFAYLVLVSLVAALLFGVVPALRLSNLDVNSALKDGGRSATSGPGANRLSGALITAEVALAAVLLAGAGVMVRSFLNVNHANVGVRAGDLLTMAGFGMGGLPADRYPNAAAQLSFYRRLGARLDALPGVESVAFGAAPTGYTPRFSYDVESGDRAASRHRPTVATVTVSAAYFRTLGATIIAGRAFKNFDRASGQPVAIVNRRFAKEHWPGGHAVDERLRLYRGPKPGAWYTVVGVVSNIVQNDPTAGEFGPVVYLPLRQHPNPDMGLVARTRVPPDGLKHTFIRELHAVDANLPVLGLASLTERLAQNAVSQRSIAVPLLVFSAIGLLLASVGLYAVIAQIVSRRTQEIGVRTAMGATARDIRKLIFRQGLLPIGAGLGIGLVASTIVNRLLQARLVDISPADPATLVVAAAILIAAAALGCAIPARRAMRVDPVVALRDE